MKVLVAGCGSIGRRHIRNLKEIGVETVAGMDLREDRRDEARGDGADLVFGSLAEALAGEKYDAGVVAVPTGLHIQTALELVDAGLHLLIEKPLDKDLTDADKLRTVVKEKNRVVQMGFCLRYSASARRVKKLLDDGAVGRAAFIRGEYSSFLPNWHKYEDYRSFYMASAALGGGALLDECHIIDLAHMMAGPFGQIFARVAKVSDLEIETDDCFDFLIDMPSGVICNLHGDIFSQPARDNLVVVGVKGSVFWDIGTDEVTLRVPREEINEVFPAGEDRNQMYIAQSQAFLEAVRIGRPTSELDLEHGIMIQKVLAGARENSGRSPFTLE